MKYNMMYELKEGSQGKAKEQLVEEIEPETKGAKIYSDGLAHVEEQRGACAAIVNMEGRHAAATISLHSDQAKNSYRTELEGIYLGTKIAVEAGSTTTSGDIGVTAELLLPNAERNISQQVI